MIQAVNVPPDTSCPPELTTEVVNCGACGKARPRKLFSEQYRLGEHQVRLVINRCAECGQVYVSPRLDRESTDLVYRLDRQHTISHNYCWAGQTSDERFGPLLKRLKTLVARGHLLDVGCGSGNFLKAAHDHGQWRLTGIEPCHSAAEQAHCAVPVPVLETTLQQAAFPLHHFDVITLLGVLEHLHDPLATLQFAHRLLKPQGVLAIYVPNFRYLRLKDTGLLAWVRRRGWSCLAPQEHLFHFTPSSLAQLLRQAGFEMVRLDVGRPFLAGCRWQRWSKEMAFIMTNALHRSTGIHVGGIEAILRRVNVSEES